MLLGGKMEIYFPFQSKRTFPLFSSTSLSERPRLVCFPR
jgi:hypothetical protein